VRVLGINAIHHDPAAALVVDVVVTSSYAPAPRRVPRIFGDGDRPLEEVTR
jgi:hypothetical protein